MYRHQKCDKYKQIVKLKKNIWPAYVERLNKYTCIESHNNVDIRDAYYYVRHTNINTS